MKTLKRRVIWDRGGVSEVIGTILTLSITVVLFSSIIAMVNQFPAPGDTVYTDFTATIEPRDNWNNGARIHITNTGGQRLEGMWGLIAITIDSNTFSLGTKGIYDNTSYGLGIPLMPGHSNDNGDDTWDTGERWTFYRNQTQITRNSDISVVILDIGKGALVWTAQIQGMKNAFGPIISKIRADSDNRTLRMDPIAFGREFYLYADIYDPDGDLEPSSIHADLSSFLGASFSSIPMSDPDGDGTFTAGPIMGPNAGVVPIGYHIAIVRASDINGMHSSGSARVAVGLDLAGQPNLVITEKDIISSTSSPVNGQTVTIAVTIKNYGGWCNGVLMIYDIIGSSITDIGIVNFTVSQGPTQLTRSISWIATPGGEHRIMAEAIPIDAVDPDMDDNYNYTNVTVLPKILLVDDDNYPNDLSDLDAVSYMRGALESSDFSYDLYTVGPHKDGPGYILGQMKLVDYDVVIWMTGYETTKTLTAYDQQNLTSFLNDDLGRGRGGSLWMIGQYLYSDPGVSSSFFTDVLRASGFIASATGPANPLMGVIGNPISDEWNTTHIPMINRVPGKGLSYMVIPDTGEGAEITFRETAEPPVYGDAINYENATKDSRVVFFPWEFSRISDTGDQTQVAYRVLKWLGNITFRHGNDLAVSEQTVDPTFVFFNQQVRVDAVIRNNGEQDLTTQLGLFLDGRNDPEYWISSIVIPGGGNSISVSANWTAKVLGPHVLKWRVDPNNLISETNENNNEVPDYITSGQVFVEFRILVVDDDESLNNNGTLEEDTSYLTDSLGRLGYTYESPSGVNTTYVVTIGSDGPTLDLLKDYSAVFWMGGNATSALTLNDTLHLGNYINNYKGMLWLSGNDIWSGVIGANLTTEMGIASITDNMPLSHNMRGVDNSVISHGMNVSIAPNPGADTLEPLAGASGVLYQSMLVNRFCAVMFEGNTYRSFTSAFNLSTFYGASGDLLTGDEAMDEFVYMLLRWFGKPETRNEVRITERDYSISDAHPQIGSAYILRATVHNVGVGDANLLVRFLDGTVQIGSDSISISPGMMTTAEIIWRPLFAGMRTITIQVDPVGEVPEIFPWFNNNRTIELYVYFFWDDMESGASKWTHSATLLNINGEGPLDFMTSGYTTVNTDVVGVWDWARSSGVQNSTKFANSYPNSFFMEESTGAFGIKSDVLVALVLDNSPSMTDRICPDGSGRTYLEVAQDAAAAMVNQFSNNSAVGVYDFKGANENVLIGITSLAGTGRQTVIDAIYANLDQGNTNTAIWDAIGIGYMAVHNAIPLYPNNYAAIVSLGDGGDYQAADSSAFKIQSIEAGSDEWAPWGKMYPELGYPTANYPNHWGKYWFYQDPLPGEWINAGSHGGAWKANRKGLLESDIPIYTIGLALENYNPPYNNPVIAQPAEFTQDVYTHVLNTESGTVEYNFWRIANTSNAEYFYSEDGSNLEDIFKTIGQIIGSSGFNQTRSSSPAPSTRAENVDKKAVSPAFDLSQYDTAEFSFWTKYNMLSGGNGGIVGVELWEPSPAPGAWKFLYVIPPGAYTGGLYYEYNIYDDFGNPINWCFNGISGRNTFAWDYVTLDVMPLIRAQGIISHGNAEYFLGNARMVLKYMQFGGGTGVGWFIDDVKLDVSRAAGTPITASTKDIWQLDGTQAHSGSSAWSNVDPVTGFVRTGLDNSLMTIPIDLTNARLAYLSAYFKFNLNQNSGTPPDGFRVEATIDGGVTWISLNLGIRTSWGVSGTGPDSEDGVLDGKSYTGITDYNNPVLDGYWVSTSTLSRLNVDLTSLSGHQVIIRFRMATNNLPAVTYPHNNNAVVNPGFGGFFIDDVNVYGETIFG